MNTETLLPIVAEWLRDTELPKPVPRQVRLPAPPGRHTSILAVVGPRRAGKTFFLYQMIRDLLARGVPREAILFVDFEDYRLKGFRPGDMDALFAAFMRLAGKPPRYLFFDEVQALPDWSRVLRTLHNRRRFCVTVTGSTSALLRDRIASELRGRYEDVLLLPFSFREYLAFRGIAWDRALLHTPERGRIIQAFESFVRYGGFPEVCARPAEADKRKLLENYCATVVYRDILERHGVKARELLDRMLTALLAGSAELFSISAFAGQLRAAGLAGSKRTIANYLRHFEEAFFLTTTEKFSYSARVRAMNPRKVYLLDAGYALLSPEFSANAGKRLETAVAAEWRRRGAALFHFRDRHECDFLIQSGPRMSEAWQVCWDLHARNEARELQGLREAMARTGAPRGGILTFDREDTRTVGGRRIHVVPAWKWLLS